MPYEIIKKKGGVATVRCVGTGTNVITLNGPNASSLNVAGENVISADIQSIFYSSDGYWKVYRGGIEIMSLHGSDSMPLYSHGIVAISNNENQNVSTTLFGANGTLILTLGKVSDYTV